MFRTLTHHLTDPIVLIWLALGAAVGLRKYHRRLSTLLFFVASALFVLFTTPFLPHWLIAGLERQYPPLIHPPAASRSTLPTHIVVLGGGHVADSRMPYNDQLSDQALKRLVEGIRLHRLISGSQLVLSGFAREGLPDSHAQVMAKVALMLGVSPADTLLMNTPQTTMQEAQAYHQRFGGQGHPLIVVTTARHIPRAMLHFRAAGLHPVAAPTGFILKRDALPPKLLGLLPSERNLTKTKQALHEYVGMVHGRWAWRRQSSRKGG